MVRLVVETLFVNPRLENIFFHVGDAAEEACCEMEHQQSRGAQFQRFKHSASEFKLDRQIASLNQAFQLEHLHEASGSYESRNLEDSQYFIGASDITREETYRHRRDEVKQKRAFDIASGYSLAVGYKSRSCQTTRFPDRSRPSRSSRRCRSRNSSS